MKKIVFGVLLFSGLMLNLQAQVYFQGFESGNNWPILAGADSISTDAGPTYFPPNQTIRSGNAFWKVQNATDTLLLDNVNVSMLTNAKVIIHLSSVSVTSGNGAESSDDVKVYAILDGNTPSQQDIIVMGSLNARWGYDASLIASTTAGSPAIFQAPQNGYSLNNYATLEIEIPNGTSTVGLMIIAKNNSTNEIWAIDDIALVSCPSITLSGPSNACLNDTITVTSTSNGNWSVSNPAFATIISNPINTNSAQVVITNGSSVNIIFTDGASGCTFTHTVNIYGAPTPPVVGPVNAVCQGGNATLNASSNLTIHWFDSPNGPSLGTGTTFTTPPLNTPGTITYYAATQNANGCFSTKVPISISVLSKPTVFNLMGGKVCAGDDAIFSLDGSENNIEYELYINNNPTNYIQIGNGSPMDFILANPNAGDTIHIVATDPNSGCSSQTDTVHIVIANPPLFYPYNTDTIIICENAMASFQVLGSQVGVEYTVLVNGNYTPHVLMGTGSALSFAVSGLMDGDEISVFAIDTTTGCFTEFTNLILVLTNPAPNVTISEIGGIITADSSSGNFVWIKDGNILSGQNNDTLFAHPFGSGNYTLIYTNAYGCTDTSNTLNVIISNLSIASHPSIHAFPNPFSEYIQISTSESITVEFYNAFGQKVLYHQLTVGSHFINTELLPKGIYFLRTITSSQIFIDKFIKN